VHGFGGYAAGSPLPNLTEVFAGAKPANSPPIIVEKVPGQAFQYSGGGFVVIQQAILDNTSMPFADFLRQTVLQPLGMHNSTFEQPFPAALQGRVAVPVDEKGTPIQGGPHIYPEMAAAGLWTTPTDLAKWLIEVQQSLAGSANHVLSPAMTRTMLTPVKGGYGLGVETSSTKGVIQITHGGANAGYRAQYFADSAGNGVVIMTSSDGGGVLIGELLRGIAAEYGWDVYPQTDRVASDTSVGQQRAYVGSFTSSDGFKFKVIAGQGHLDIQFSDGTTGPFFPSGSESFFAVASTLQVHFKSPDHGELIFAPDDKIEFSRDK
jgi:CubicO group peptidase (beta-lactamase class C family)